MSGDLPLPPWPDARLVQCNTRTPYCGMWRVLGGNRHSSGYCATREDAVAQAWQTWERLSGVSRERWEAMERDHRAMEAWRSGKVLVSDSDGPLEALRFDGDRCVASACIDTGGGHEGELDPADAILAALNGEEASDGE